MNRETTPNRAFWRALHSLVHPLSIGAVLLLLFNDHWLRHNYPSWLTGKLGDFTWLMFAPFIAAAVFAWLIPRRVGNHEQVVGGASFAFIGLWFALAKTVPAVHLLTTETVEAIVGWEGTLRLDATDLLTLPALAVGWYVWRRVGNNPISLRPAVYVVGALGIVGTLASDGPYYSYTDSGIVRLCEQGTLLITTTPAGGYYYYTGTGGEEDSEYELTTTTNVFTSEDGGLTWDSERIENYDDMLTNCTSSDAEMLIDPGNESIQYRWQPGERIERSTDGGQTWALEYGLSVLQQDVRKHYNHKTTSFENDLRYRLSPVTGLIHEETGNVVLAMSWDGVLIRAPDGEWQWVQVGKYQLADISGFDRIGNLLFFELWLAGAMAFLVVTTSAAYMRREFRRFKGLGLVIGWGGWIFLVIASLSAKLENGYEITVGLISLPLLLLIALPLSISAVWDIARNFRDVWRPITVTAIGVGVLFLFPFILWSQGTIPRYVTASLFALLLTGAGLITGYKYLRPLLPIVPHRKKKGKPKPLPGDEQ